MFSYIISTYTFLTFHTWASAAIFKHGTNVGLKVLFFGVFLLFFVFFSVGPHGRGLIVQFLGLFLLFLGIFFRLPPRETFLPTPFAYPNNNFCT